MTIADSVGLGKTDDTKQLLLLTHLQFAVPLRIQELQELAEQDEDALDRIHAALPDRMQQGADSMQFGNGQRGEISRNISAWTTALALAAIRAQGGIDYAGLHWCANPYCRATSRYDHADEYPATEPEPEPTPRPIVDIHLPEPEGEAA